ncbi:MAG: hypothetical protein MJA82_14420 [Clostridia bacterium]|nr:hypothetical protein [Clostridia bacterium]
MKNSFNIEGAIIDLTRHNYNSKNKIKEFKSINEAIEIINEIYNRSEVTLNELLSSIIINNCSVEEILEIVSAASIKIDGFQSNYFATSARNYEPSPW